VYKYSIVRKRQKADPSSHQQKKEAMASIEQADVAHRRPSSNNSQQNTLTPAVLADHNTTMNNVSITARTMTDQY